MNKHTPSRSLTTILALTALAPLALGQASAGGPSEDGAGDLTVLPEFSVKANPLSDYLAAESVTGTRVAVKLEDLPFAVNVVTSEFINDFNLLEWKDQFAYVSNVGQSETQSPGYTLRGFTADTQLRNGFRRIGLIDKVNIDRVEVIKGPAASIYGAVVPGGAINVITRMPKTKPEYRLSTSAGNYGSLRGELSATGPLGNPKDKLYYRFDGAAYTREYKTAFRKQEQYTAALQLAYKPTPSTSILLGIEHLVRDETANTSATIPFIVETRTNPYVPGRTYNHYLRLADEAFTYVDPKTGSSYAAADLSYFSTQGPATYANRWVKSADLTVEHRFSEIFSLRCGANTYKRDLERNEVGSRDQYNPVTGTVQRGTARLRLYPESGTSVQNDLLASFNTGKVAHKLLFTIDYLHSSETPKQYDGASNSFFPTAVASGLSVRAPDYSFVSYKSNPGLYGNPVSSEYNLTDTTGLFLSERATFWQERVNLMLGGRYDTVKKHNRVWFPAASDDSSRTSEFTYQTGLNVKVTSDLALFASASSSFLPQSGSGWRLTDGGAGFESFMTPNERGHGWEGGAKFNAFSHRLNMTLSYFSIQREDVVLSSVSVTLPNNSSQKITPINTEKARGVDFDFSWLLTDELQVLGAYGYNDGKVEKSDVARWMIGTRLRRAPMHNAGVALKYEFKHGPLKGLYANAGVKYYGDSQANPGSGQSINPSQVTSKTPFINLRMANGLLPFEQYAEGASLTSIPYTVIVANGREQVLNKAYTAYDAGLGYKWKTGRYGHRLQVNVSNLSNVRYTFGSSSPGDPLMYSASYELRF